MNGLNQPKSNIEPETNLSPELITWLVFLEKGSLFPPNNVEKIAESVKEARLLSCGLPMILTLCPAIENLTQTTKQEQTRRLIPLSESNERLKKFIQEFIAFSLITKRITGLGVEFFLLFADLLEPDSERMFINVGEMPAIAEESIKTIRQLLFRLDQDNPGLFQQSEIKIPRVRKQSKTIKQAGKAGININQLIERVEFETFDPSSPAHSIFERQLKLTREDQSFVPTGWQTRKGREAIHNRIRFMVAQLWTDGVALPLLMDAFLRKGFPKGMPNPIFIVSSTREAGAILQTEGFNWGAKHPEVLKIPSAARGVISPFKNTGRWEQEPEESLLADQIKFKD